MSHSGMQQNIKQSAHANKKGSIRGFFGQLTIVFLAVVLMTGTVPAAALAQENNPITVTVTAQSTSRLQIVWDSVPEASYYNVYRSVHSAGPFSYMSRSTSPSYIDTGLSENTQYYYLIEAYSSNNALINEGQGNGKTDAYPQTLTVLVQATSTSQLDLSWTDIPGAQYQVLRSTYNGGYAHIATVYTPHYTDTGLQQDTTYYYKVESSVGVEGVGQGTTLSPDVPPVIPPVVPPVIPPVIDPPVVTPPVVVTPVVDPPLVVPPKVVPPEEEETPEAPQTSPNPAVVSPSNNGGGNENRAAESSDSSPSTTPFSNFLASIFGGDIPTVHLFGTEVPLAAKGHDAWALGNLVLAAVGIVLAVLFVALHYGRLRVKEGEVNRQKLFLRIVTAALALIAVLLFFLTEDLALSLVLVDQWTIVHVVLVAAQIVCGTLSIRKKSVSEKAVRA